LLNSIEFEEEELQSQEMAIGQYMIDEDCPSDPHHEHVQAPPHLSVRKELIIMRKRKRSKLSNLSPRKIQTRLMIRK
jgi:hypothetical protein